MSVWKSLQGCKELLAQGFVGGRVGIAAAVGLKSSIPESLLMGRISLLADQRYPWQCGLQRAFLRAFFALVIA